MKLAQILKINFLLLGLIAVVFLMLQLKSGSLRDGVNDLFGAPNNDVLTENVEKSRVWSWCLSQVTAIEAGGRQVSEHYKEVGKKASQLDTSYNFYSRVMNSICDRIKIGGYAISMGWNSNGFGKSRGFKIVEILIVAHGMHHNDTIVTVEQKTYRNQSLFEKRMNQ